MVGLSGLLGALDDQALQLEQATANKAPIPIARGDARQLELPLPAKAPALPERWQIQVRDVRASRAVTIAAWVDRSNTSLRYILQAQPEGALGPHVLSATLTLIDEKGRKLQSFPVRHKIQVTEASGTSVEVETAKRAFRFHQGHAQAAYAQLESLHNDLRLDRVDRPPRLSKVPKDKEELLQRFYHHRVRAEIARGRLHALAQLKVRGTADQAALAIGGLTERPTGPAQKARAIDGVTTERGIAIAREALWQLRIDQAEGFLNRLRSSGRLEPSELASVLQLLGAVYLLRGRKAEATTTLGRSLCLSPDQKNLLKRPLLKESFETLRSSRKCTKPISIAKITATREDIDGTLYIVVSADYAPDPYRLGAKGVIQIFGTGGGVSAERKMEVNQAKSSFEARFKDEGQFENFAGRILLKGLLQDLSGVTIATIGDPDPLSLPIVTGESASGIRVPWWVWVVIGGAAVVGGATAGAVVLARRDSGGPTRGIGPIEVSF